jgi:transposase-like protein
MKRSEEKASITVREFFTQFPDDESCLQHVFDNRYGQGPVCPKCVKKSNWSRMEATRAFVCQWCGHHIHPTAGTLFEDTRTPLQLWFYAIYLFTTSRHGVSGKELERKLGVTYKTAWRMGHEIRKHMALVDGELPLSGHVEIDETYVGGRHAGVRGRGAAGKTVVFGMLQRDGQVMTKVVPNVAKKTLQPIIEANDVDGSTVHTDELHPTKAWQRLQAPHQNHGAGESAARRVNGLENFGSTSKAASLTHMHVSKSIFTNTQGI